MNYSDFIKQIKNREMNSSYVFIGEEDYLKDECVQMIRKEFLTESMEVLNYSVLDGKMITIEDLINTCETLPFMSEKRVVVLKEVSAFFDREIKDDKIYDYLEDLGHHLLLIMLDDSNELKKNTKIYKYYSKNNKVVEFTKLKGKDLNTWVEESIRSRDKHISTASINYFIQSSTYLSKNIASTLYDLENEIVKLVNYAKDSEINNKDIDNVMVKTIDNNIFDLLTAINKGDVERSISIFNDIYILNEPVLKILFMITRQIRLMLQYRFYREKGYAEGEIMDNLSIKPYEYGKISSQARTYDDEQLKHFMNLILSVDKRLKTTSADEKIQMEVLLVNLCRKTKAV